MSGVTSPPKAGKPSRGGQALLPDQSYHALTPSSYQHKPYFSNKIDVGIDTTASKPINMRSQKSAHLVRLILRAHLDMARIEFPFYNSILLVLLEVCSQGRGYGLVS